MRRRYWIMAIGLLVLALTSFVSPFSYVPNPLGLAYLLGGSYRYDPHSPLINRFATLGTPDPTPALTAQLERLLGQTGLDPLDPQHPLVGYRVREIITGRPPWAGSEYAEARVEFRYASGAALTYQLSTWQYGMRYDGSRTIGWRYTSLDRHFTEHLELSHLPLATADSTPTVGPPRLVASAPPLGQRRALTLSQSTSWNAIIVEPYLRLRPSPDGRSALLHARDDAQDSPAWHIGIDGGSARLIAEHALDAAWLADGRIALLRCDNRCASGGRFDLVIARPTTGEARTLGSTRARSLAIIGGAIYLLDEEALWRQSPDGGAAERLAPVAGVSSWLGAGLAVAPDGERFAYRCDDDVCLGGTNGATTTRVGLGYPRHRNGPPDRPAPILPSAVAEPIVATERTSPLAALGLAWSPDGSRLAIATGIYPGSDRGPELWIVDRFGRAQLRLPIGPDGTTGEPTWAAGGRTILLNTFPRGGRRIVAVDAETGRATDLSQPRWDTFASVMPDGQGLLLWNGRGNFWLAPLTWRTATTSR